MANKSAWDFVEKFYPDYYSSNDIARADDLQKLLDGEVNGNAEKILNEEYGGDIDNPQIKIDYTELHHDIYIVAIEEFINNDLL
jgi:hypothetical protein